MRISDWSSDVCSSDLEGTFADELDMERRATAATPAAARADQVQAAAFLQVQRARAAEVAGEGGITPDDGQAAVAEHDIARAGQSADRRAAAGSADVEDAVDDDAARAGDAAGARQDQARAASDRGRAGVGVDATEHHRAAADVQVAALATHRSVENAARARSEARRGGKGVGG